MTEELKPCPFCGEKTELEIDDPFEFIAEDFFVFCNKCSTTGPLGETKDEAIAAWNRRV